MSTASQFQNMLNQFIPNSLLENEFIKRDWFLQNLEHNKTWRGGQMQVPFVGGRESTIKMGGLAATNDINQLITVRGTITNQPEIWASMIFNEKDLIRNNKVDEQSLLKLLPNRIESMMNTLKECVSFNIASGSFFATSTVAGTLSAGITVDRIDRFGVGMPIVLTTTKYWVKSADLNTNIVVLATDMALTTVADLSGFGIGAQFFFDGGETAANRLTSLRQSLLSAANGGLAQLYGVTKTSYPYTQAINRSGASYTRANFLDQLFADYVEIRTRGKGNPDTMLMSYRMWGVVMAYLELEKGAYRQADDMKPSKYDFQEVTITGPRGSAKIVGIHEMDDDVIHVINKSAATIYSNGGIRKRVGPDGLEFYVQRDAGSGPNAGYKYVVDITFQGDVVLEAPSTCGIIYSLPTTLFTP